MTDPNLAAALAKLQADMPTVRKGETAQVRSDKGNYSYTYANLADCSRAILPKLAALGLSFSSKPTISEAGQFVLAYVLRHESGESDAGDYPLPDPNRSTPQQVGSAITYARRYALCAVTGLSPDDDDDDGNAATAGQARAEREAEERRATTQRFLVEFPQRISEAKTTVAIASLDAELKNRWQAGVVDTEETKSLKAQLDERANDINAANEVPA